MKKVALLLDDEQNLYQQLLAQEAVAQMRRLEVEILGPHYANGSSFTQMEQLFGHAGQDLHPDALLLVLAGRQSQQRVCGKLLAAGVALVFLNRVPDYLGELRAAFPDLLVAGVAPDQVQIGHIQAEQCLNLLPSGGRVLLVTGTHKSPSATARKLGFEERLPESFELHSVEGEWTEQSGYDAAMHRLRLVIDPDRAFNVVVCQNDQMARGARRALMEHAASIKKESFGEAPVLGCDGLPTEGRKMVIAQELAGTVIMPTTTKPALELLSAYWRTGSRASRVSLPSDSYPPLDQLKLA